MDLERVIAGKLGVSEGYEFTQTDRACTVVVNLQTRTEKQDIEVFLDTNAIFVRNAVTNVLYVCGKLYAPVFNQKHQFIDTQLRIDLQKQESKRWPLLVSGPSAAGIDYKSEFMTGVLLDCKGKHKEAWQVFEKLSSVFLTAKLFVIDVLVSDINPYGVAKDKGRAAQLLLSIKNVPDDKALFFFDLFLKNDLPSKALTVYNSIKNPSHALSIRMAKALLEHHDPQAFLLLDKLSAENDPEAMRILAREWYPSNKERAIELDRKAHALDPSTPLLFPTRTIARDVLIGAGISAVIAGGALYFFSRRR